MNRILSLTIILLALFSINSHASDNFGHYRALFKNHQFAQLEEEQKKVNEQFINSDKTWTEFYSAFFCLYYDRDFQDKWLEKAIDDLEASSSDSAYRLLNLGIYYTELGYEIRGSGWRNTVSDYDIKKMYDSFAIAAQYLNQALEKDASLLAAYQNLISIAKNESGKESDDYIAATFQQALQVKGDNFALAKTVLYAKLPRWGGSYVEMENMVDMLKPHFSSNMTDYNKLNSFLIHDKLEKHIKKQRFKHVLRELEPYQNIHSFVIQQDLAKIYRDTEKWEKCYQHAKIAADEAPYSDIQGVLGICANKLEKWEESIQAYIKHFELNGPNAWTLFYLADAYEHLGYYEIAYPLYKESIIIRADYKQYSLRHINKIKDEHPDKTNLKIAEAYKKIGVGG
ncbi:hypothetical protein L3V77_09775 [Vibrio sp. DW001]|uniref:tetratricopeptide repeat protein n=1 Tax=Vibrio sp. DW001 TaxID=2912315 RepID=UPI0023AE9F33|nr:hypothetical protein [Vibrio sp. DW001]WED25361.1 hypothetical protein L3V77_09775 [Vibrio sp. DW001]